MCFIRDSRPGVQTDMSSVPLDEDVTMEKERVQSNESMESDVLRVTDLSKVWMTTE